MKGDVVDWRALAERFGTIGPIENGWSETGGDKLAQTIIAERLGDDFISEAVDFAVSRRPGSELARSVLRLLRPPAAMDRCLEIFQTSANPDLVAMSIHLLRDVADKRVLDAMPAIQASTNAMARAYATRILDQLWMDGLIEPDEGRPYLDAALHDDDEMVRRAATNLLEMWDRDAAIDRGADVE